MGKRRSMMRAKKYDDAYRRKTMRPWSDLTHDVLIFVMTQLGFVDFLAFNRVCKSWRSLAVSNKNKFIVSRPSMSISICIDANKKVNYYLEDFEGRKLKIILPYIAGRKCVGVTCGYFMLCGDETTDFWLVNPITRHELHFPNVPGEFFCCYGNVSAILVFSPSISGWVLVMYTTCYCYDIWFCIAGKREWNKLSAPRSIDDLIAFKGKIFTIHSTSYQPDGVFLCEMKLYSKPELVLLETKNIQKSKFIHPRFVRCGENLYVIDRDTERHPYNIYEIDIEEMKLVSREKTGQEYVFFRSNSKRVNHSALYDGKYVVADKNGKGRLFKAEMWYFFTDCLNVDLIHE